MSAGALISSDSVARRGLLTPLLFANVLVLALYAYSMCEKAFADYPDGDEAAVMSGLANGDKSYLKGWPAYIRVVQSAAYHVARIRTVRGLQLLGALFAICGATGINVLTLTRLRLPGPWQILCLSLFNLALILNTEAHKWATFAILLYPMRIFAGFVFVYVLATYSQSERSPGPGQTVLLGLAMSLLTFVHPGLIIPECAMAFSLWTTLVIRRQMAFHRIKHWALPLVMFLLLPGLVAVAVVLGAPHAEMQTPRDDIRALYFPLNDSYPKTPAGLAEFVFAQLKWLIFYVCLPRSYVHWGEAHSLVSSLPLLLLAAGLARSLVRPAETRFSVAVFILMDLALRLAADLAGKFPFGGLERYALSQVFGLALMVSLGASDIFLGAALLASAASPARIRRLYHSRARKLCPGGTDTG